MQRRKKHNLWPDVYPVVMHSCCTLCHALLVAFVFFCVCSQLTNVTGNEKNTAENLLLFIYII